MPQVTYIVRDEPSKSFVKYCLGEGKFKFARREGDAAQFNDIDVARDIKRSWERLKPQHKIVIEMVTRSVVE